MRLLHIFHDDRHAKTFSSYLTQQGIENRLEISKNHEWDSEHYGDPICKIWVIDEDRTAQAKEYLETYLDNPHKSDYISLYPDKPGLSSTPPPPPPRKKHNDIGKATFICIFLCGLLLFLSMVSRAPFQPFPSDLPAPPLFLSKLEKELYFDYPAAYEIVDKLESTYGLKALVQRDQLTSEGRKLLAQYKKTPYWQGLYPLILDDLKADQQHSSSVGPLFEKLRQGQVWRLVTPIFLHADIFHLFFNMVWLFVLGAQMESRLGMMRYLLFILITAVGSNSAQYLMSGPNFIGFSGVLCAMIMFVWMRQKKTPWEGYQLQRTSMKFVTWFILLIFGMQCVSFVFELLGIHLFALPIANTAHLAGGFIGYLLSRLDLFKKRSTNQ